MFSDVPIWEWILFGGVVVVMVAMDLWVHRGSKGESRGRAIVWSVVWIAVGLGFGGHVWLQMGGQKAQEYLAAYLIEKSLSLDNLFVFLIIFKTLGIPKDSQRSALLWGIFGAVVFRALFVFIGAAALHRWQWVEYIFAAILLYAAWHAFREQPSEQKESRLVHWLADRLPVTRDTSETKFLRRDGGSVKVTPLLVAIIGLELTDVLFAIDSVPAAFSVTRDVFIVYTSNVFAILGLRALYIVLAKTIADLQFLHYGLAAVLAFAAVKMLIARWMEIPPLLSVALIVIFIGLSIWASLRHRSTARRGSADIPSPGR